MARRTALRTVAKAKGEFRARDLMTKKPVVATLPGTRTDVSTFASARGFSIFKPNSSSTSGFRGQGSAIRMYSSAVTPHMRDA